MSGPDSACHRGWWLCVTANGQVSPARPGFARIVAVVGNVGRALFFGRQRPALDLQAKKALMRFG
jgi:hypothetical protein